MYLDTYVVYYMYVCVYNHTYNIYIYTYIYIYIHGGFLKWGYPEMDDL